MSSPHPAPFAGHESDLRALLDWVGQAAGRPAHVRDAEVLLQHTLALRSAPINTPRRVELLDLLYAQTARTVHALIPALPSLRLPIPLRARTRLNMLLTLLEVQAQDHLSLLSELFDPDVHTPATPPWEALGNALQCLAWHLCINDLCHAPAGVGIWQQLHATFATARQLGVEKFPSHRDGRSAARRYGEALLAHIAQPLSFSVTEFQFVCDYIARLHDVPVPMPRIDAPGPAVFWLSADRDQPPQASVRRPPPNGILSLYIDASRAAAQAGEHLAALEAGETAYALDLPDFAASERGRFVLNRLQRAWGAPPKRRFPRRKQAFRLQVQAGLPGSANSAPWSQWMVTNESPDGFALMHVSGSIRHLVIGQTATLRGNINPLDDEPETHAGLIRWTLSENPEHFEIGVQLLPPQTYRGEAGQPRADTGSLHPFLVIPPAPPLRSHWQLLGPTGALDPKAGKVVVVSGETACLVREFRLDALEEQTGSLSLWAVTPDETP